MNKQIIKKTPEQLAYDFRKTLIDPILVVGETENAVKCIPVNWRDDFYYWIERDGVFKRIADTEIRKQVASYLQALNDILEPDEQIKITRNLILDILLNLSAIKGVHIPESRELNSWSDQRERGLQTLVFQNCILMYSSSPPEDWRENDHTPEYFTLSKLPYAYDPVADCPRWLAFLIDVLMGRKDYIRLIQQWVGYLLTQDLRYHKFLLCYGEGANGKGVFFEVVKALLGADNVSHIPLSTFGNRFALYDTIGKMVNITHESSSFVQDEAENVLKSFVAGDAMSFERKFKQSVSATPTAKVMISTNSKPRFNDKSQAIWRRILLVPFDKTIPQEEQNPNLADELKKELSGIINWALDGYIKLQQENGFIMPKDAAEQMDEYRRIADPARAFLQDNYETSNNGEYVNSDVIYNAYRLFCEKDGYRASSESTFGKSIKSTFPTVEKKRKGPNGNRFHVYEGLVGAIEKQLVS